jgi:hypothetical protein
LGRGEASCRQSGGNSRSEGIVVAAVDPHNRSLNLEHLYQREIRPVTGLAKEVEDCLALSVEVRPHKALGQERLLVVHRGDPPLSNGALSKSLDTIHRVVISEHSSGNRNAKGT